MAGRYQFGPFCLDATKRVLLREGERVALTAKSVDTLLALVERPGETVGKRDLIDIVWGHAAIEENNLNQCISAIRKALGEQRGQHEYIVTVTGVGYRFVAPVTEVPDIAPDAAPETEATLVQRANPKRRFPFRIASLAAVLTTLAIAIYATHDRLPGVGETPKRRTAVILALKNLPGTADTAWLSVAIGEMLFHELAGPGALRVISPDEAALMARDLPQTRSSADSLRDIRTYTGADFALGGTVTMLPGTSEKPLRIDLHVQDLRTGEIIAASSVDGVEGQTFSMVRTLADRLRQPFGLTAVASAGRHSPVPSSIPAMQLYADGLAALRSSDFRGAKDRLLQAVEADPANALCYSALSTAWFNLGYDKNAAEAARRAFELSSSLDELDRLAIEGRYRFASHDWQRAAGIYEAIWKLVPDSIEDARALTDAYVHSQRSDQASRVIATLRRLPPPLRDDPRIDLMEAKVVRETWSDYRRVVALARQAAEKADQRHMRDLYANARLLQSNTMPYANMPGAEKVRAEAGRICEELKDLFCEAQISRSEGNRHFSRGEMREAETSWRKALALSRQIGNVGEQANELNGLGLMHYLTDDFAAAETDFRDALQVDVELKRKIPETLINYGVFLIAAGQLDKARRDLAEALKESRAFHEVQSEANSAGEMSELERVSGNPRNAVEMARSAVAAAKQSGDRQTVCETNMELALALSAIGDANGAGKVLSEAESCRAHTAIDQELDLAKAAIALNEGSYGDAERAARMGSEEARTMQCREFEILARSLLAHALLGLGRIEEARAEAARAAAPPQPSARALSHLESRFAELAVNAPAQLPALAEEARQTGDIELALRIRLAAAAHGGTRQSLRQLEADCAVRGYGRLAKRALALMDSPPRK